MLKLQLQSSPAAMLLPVLILDSKSTSHCCANNNFTNNNDKASVKLSGSYYRRVLMGVRCGARRRVRYEDEDEEEYGHNEEIAVLELYSQSARGEALIVRAAFDDLDVEVLVFKGFSSSLSHGTSPDPSKSVLPARAVIKSIDRIKGPFDPSKIEYIEKDLQWETFKSRLVPT